MSKGPFFGRAYPGKDPTDVGNIGPINIPDMPAKVGTVYEGYRGQYVIRGITSKGDFDVMYVSGEWQGKPGIMSRRIHNSQQFRRKIVKATTETSQEARLTKLLDLFYKKYPNLYKAEWTKDIYADDLWQALETKYPYAVENIEDMLEENL